MRCTLLLFLTLLLAPAHAVAQQTLTTRDIVELTKAGLAEEVLLALIDVHRPVFPVDTATLKSLKDSGVAPNVIVAMVRSGREVPAPPVVVEQTPPPPPPQPLYDEPEQYEQPRVRYEERVREVAVPVYVTMPYGYGGYGVTQHSRPIVRPDVKPAEPVYWGFGGKRRPDSWDDGAGVQKDARIPVQPQKK